MRTWLAIAFAAASVFFVPTSARADLNVYVDFPVGSSGEYVEIFSTASAEQTGGCTDYVLVIPILTRNGNTIAEQEFTNWCFASGQVMYSEHVDSWQEADYQAVAAAADESGSQGCAALSWHISLKTTFYTNPEQSAIACWYGSTACSSGFPTCTSGVGFSLTGSFCTTFAKAKWVVGTRGTSNTCLTAISYPAGGPGPCS